MPKLREYIDIRRNFPIILITLPYPAQTYS